LRYLLYGSLVIIAAVVLLAGIQLFVICRNTKKMTYDSKPFIRSSPDARLRFLFLGDSTAVGTGARNSTESVAGYFGQDFPDAAIDNNSYNGRKLNQLIAEFPRGINKKYDVVVLQIGANDIMKFTPYKTIEREIAEAIEDAKGAGRQVVILHSGNVGLAPAFIWPFNWIMTERARVVRRIYMKKATEHGVLYVDLFTERDNDLFLKDIPKYYCPDMLHPSGEGYKWWYERIRATLSGAGVVL
jgi:lysophospholipase L1-like esterase